MHWFYSYTTWFDEKSLRWRCFVRNFSGFCSSLWIRNPIRNCWTQLSENFIESYVAFRCFNKGVISTYVPITPIIWSKKKRLKLWFISEMLYKCTQWPVHCTDVQLYTITRIRTLPGRVQNSGGVDNGEGNITSRLKARMYVSIETPRIHIIGFVKCRF